MLNTKDTDLLSISELTHSIKSILETQFRFVHVYGEVSNLRTPFSGHTYFTLKDSNAQIRAVLFKGQQRYLAEKVKEGQSIICHGRISVYEQRGEYQIIVDTVDFKGKGDLRLEFERLKNQLLLEGLFQNSKKRQIPTFPEHIFLVTSPTGAAVHDFIKIANKRKYLGKITVFPVTVQGKNSGTQIVDAIDIINTSLDADLIIMIRGGGSLEDLWTFNEEQVVRAVSDSQIPVVTGIGHETDVTIVDLCADLHTHTPTAAAEATIPDSYLLLHTINNYKATLHLEILNFINEKERIIQHLRRIMGNLGLYLDNHTLKLDRQTTAFLNAFQLHLSGNMTRLQLTTDKLLRFAPISKINLQKQHIGHLQQRLEQNMVRLLEKKQSLLGRQIALMESVSPLSILARGYSVVSRTSIETDTTTIVSQATQVERGDLVDVLLHEGSLRCQVTDRKLENK